MQAKAKEEPKMTSMTLKMSERSSAALPLIFANRKALGFSLQMSAF
jgi:hypothetical protein